MAVNCSKDEAIKYRAMMGAKATYDVLIQDNCSQVRNLMGAKATYNNVL